MYHSLFIWSPTEGHPGCFQVLAIMKKAAKTIHEQIFVWTWVFISFGCIPRSTTAGSYGKSTFNFVRTAKLSSEVWTAAEPFCIPTSSEWEFLVLHILASIWWCQCPDFGHSNGCSQPSSEAGGILSCREHLGDLVAQSIISYWNKLPLHSLFQ